MVMFCHWLSVAFSMSPAAGLPLGITTFLPQFVAVVHMAVQIRLHTKTIFLFASGTKREGALAPKVGPVRTSQLLQSKKVRPIAAVAGCTHVTELTLLAFSTLVVVLL